MSICALRVELQRAWANRLCRWALIVCTLSLLGLFFRFVGYPRMLDLQVYRAEGFALRNGIGLYGDIGAPDGLLATYPPFAVVCFTLLTFIPERVAIIMATAADIALLLLAVELTRRMLNRNLAGRAVRPLPAVVTLVASSLLVWCEPVYSTVCFGQINLLLLVLVLLDFSLTPKSKWRGVALGIAIGIKLTPAIFVLYLLTTKRFTHAARAVAVFALTVCLSLLVRAQDTWDYFTKFDFETDRLGSVAQGVNQSINGVMARAMHTMTPGAAATAVSVVVGVGGLVVARSALTHRGEAFGLVAAGITGLLVSPVSWSHHWVWCVPTALLFCSIARDAKRAAKIGLGAAFLIFYWWMPQWIPRSDENLHMGFWEQLISLPYVAFGLVFLAVLGATSRRSHGVQRPVSTSESAVRPAFTASDTSLSVKT